MESEFYFARYMKQYAWAARVAGMFLFISVYLFCFFISLFPLLVASLANQWDSKNSDASLEAARNENKKAVVGGHSDDSHMLSFW